MATQAQATINVTIQPGGTEALLPQGITAFEALKAINGEVETPCNGKGTCGKCKVHISGGVNVPLDTERRHLTEEELSRGIRLGCQARLEDDAIIQILTGSWLGTPQILTGSVEIKVEPAYNVKKRFVEVSQPSLEDQRGDTERLLAVLGGNFKMPRAVISGLPGVLRKDGFKVTVVTAGEEILAVEPGDTTGRCFGVAFDIGTTTVVGTLMDLVTGRSLAMAASTNPQVAFGSDVITRINFAEED